MTDVKKKTKKNKATDMMDKAKVFDVESLKAEVDKAKPKDNMIPKTVIDSFEGIIHADKVLNTSNDPVSHDQDIIITSPDAEIIPETVAEKAPYKATVTAEPDSDLKPVDKTKTYPGDVKYKALLASKDDRYKALEAFYHGMIPIRRMIKSGRVVRRIRTTINKLNLSELDEIMK